MRVTPSQRDLFKGCSRSLRQPPQVKNRSYYGRSTLQAFNPTNMPSATLPPSPTNPPTTAALPPSTFDIIPPLHTLLTRLLLPPPTNASHTTQPQSGITPAALSPAPANSPSVQNQIISTSYLFPKDLSIAASAVKIKIQKARVVVTGLPDVERTIEEQESEIGELEWEVERLKGVLKELGESGRRAAESLAGNG